MRIELGQPSQRLLTATEKVRRVGYEQIFSLL